MNGWGTYPWGFQAFGSGAYSAQPWGQDFPYLFWIDGIRDRISGNDLTDTSAGAAQWLDDNNVVQTTAATVPLNVTTGNRGLTGKGNWEQFLTSPTTPANQTTGSLGTGFYTHWVLGPGSGAISGNGATIVGAGSATEGSPLTFEVTVAGTVDFVKTGTLTHIQLHDGVSANYPLFKDSVGSVGSRAGTITAADLATAFPKLYDALGNVSPASAKHTFDWTPGVDTFTGVDTTLLTCDAGSGASAFLSCRAGARLRLADGTTSINIDKSYVAETTYPVEIITGPKVDDSNNIKMQLNVKVLGVWYIAIADFDGSFNPTTALTYFLSNDCQHSVNNHKVQTLKQTDWR